MGKGPVARVTGPFNLRDTITAMMSRSHLVACSLALFAAHAHADEPHALESAAAEMHTHVVIANSMLRKCSEATPTSKGSYQVDMTSWQRRDAKAIQRADAVWREMEAVAPQTAEERARDAVDFERLWATVTNVSGAKAPGVIAQRCANYFSALAHGVWRSQSPRMYQLLEK